jgi:hypothetical protein
VSGVTPEKEAFVERMREWVARLATDEEAVLAEARPAAKVVVEKQWMADREFRAAIMPLMKPFVAVFRRRGLM